LSTRERKKEEKKKGRGERKKERKREREREREEGRKEGRKERLEEGEGCLGTKNFQSCYVARREFGATPEETPSDSTEPFGPELTAEELAEVPWTELAEVLRAGGGFIEFKTIIYFYHQNQKKS
jgi:hypothetical protein